jgi:hypothetical protein
MKNDRIEALPLLHALAPMPKPITPSHNVHPPSHPYLVGRIVPLAEIPGLGEPKEPHRNPSAPGFVPTTARQGLHYPDEAYTTRTSLSIFGHHEYMTPGPLTQYLTTIKIWREKDDKLSILRLLVPI